VVTALTVGLAAVIVLGSAILAYLVADELLVDPYNRERNL
jgi:hypothetical protein